MYSDDSRLSWRRACAFPMLPLLGALFPPPVPPGRRCSAPDLVRGSCAGFPGIIINWGGKYMVCKVVKRYLRAMSGAAPRPTGCTAPAQDFRGKLSTEGC